MNPDAITPKEWELLDEPARLNYWIERCPIELVRAIAGKLGINAADEMSARFLVGMAMERAREGQGN